jgi:hypothetical protein
VCYVAEVKDLVAATKDGAGRRRGAGRPSLGSADMRLSRHRTTRSSSDSAARSPQRKRSLIAVPLALRPDRWGPSLSATLNGCDRHSCAH